MAKVTVKNIKTMNPVEPTQPGVYVIDVAAKAKSQNQSRRLDYITAVTKHPHLEQYKKQEIIYTEAWYVEYTEGSCNLPWTLDHFACGNKSKNNCG